MRHNYSGTCFKTATYVVGCGETCPPNNKLRWNPLLEKIVLTKTIYGGTCNTIYEVDGTCKTAVYTGIHVSRRYSDTYP